MKMFGDKRYNPVTAKVHELRAEQCASFLALKRVIEDVKFGKATDGFSVWEDVRIIDALLEAEGRFRSCHRYDDAVSRLMGVAIRDAQLANKDRAAAVPLDPAAWIALDQALDKVLRLCEQCL